MFIISEFSNYYSLFCLVFGLITNFLLIWLVLYKTPKIKLLHSRILLQTCVLDILTILCYFLVRPALIEQKDSLVFFINGIVAKFFTSPLTQFRLMMLTNAPYYFGTVAICAQFLYRYLYLGLNCQIKITFPKYLLILCVPFLPNLILLFCFYFMALPNLRVVPPSDPITVEAPAGKLIQRLEINIPVKILGILMLLLVVISYGINFICARKIIKYVRENAFPEHLKELNRQLTRTLIVLALLPLCFALSNAMWIISTIRKDEQLRPIFYIISVYLALLLPVINPLTGIFLTRPYRQAVVDKFMQIYR